MAIFPTTFERLLALRSVKSVAFSSASSTNRFWDSSAFVDLLLIVGALSSALSAVVHSLEMYYKLTMNNILIHPLKMTRGGHRKTLATPGPYFGSEKAAANKAQGGCQFREKLV